MRDGIERFVATARRIAVLLVILCAFLLLLASAPAAGAASAPVPASASVPASAPAQLVRWDGRWLENVSGGRCRAQVLMEGPQGPRSRVYLLAPGERKNVAGREGERAVSVRAWAL